jgi:hypothetical protein
VTVQLRTWADIAVVFLSIQCFVIMLIPLVLTFFMVRGMNMAHGALPQYLIKAQGYSRIMRDQTVNAGDKIAAPLIHVRAQQARVDKSIRSFSQEVDESLFGPCEPDDDVDGSIAHTQGAQHNES